MYSVFERQETSRCKLTVARRGIYFSRREGKKRKRREKSGACRMIVRFSFATRRRDASAGEAHNERGRSIPPGVYLCVSRSRTDDIFILEYEIYIDSPPLPLPKSRRWSVVDDRPRISSRITPRDRDRENEVRFSPLPRLASPHLALAPAVPSAFPSAALIYLFLINGPTLIIEPARSYHRERT